jgi:hypothetical protein
VLSVVAVCLSESVLLNNLMHYSFCFDVECYATATNFASYPSKWTHFWWCGP